MLLFCQISVLKIWLKAWYGIQNSVLTYSSRLRLNVTRKIGYRPRLFRLFHSTEIFMEM